MTFDCSLCSRQPTHSETKTSSSRTIIGKLSRDLTPWIICFELGLASSLLWFCFLQCWKKLSEGSSFSGSFAGKRSFDLALWCLDFEWHLCFLLGRTCELVFFQFNWLLDRIFYCWLAYCTTWRIGTSLTMDFPSCLQYSGFCSIIIYLNTSIFRAYSLISVWFLQICSKIIHHLLDFQEFVVELVPSISCLNSRSCYYWWIRVTSFH